MSLVRPSNRIDVPGMRTREIVTGEKTVGRWGKFHVQESTRAYNNVMTKLPTREVAGEQQPRCRWCRHALPGRDGPGRRKEFCSQRCRQWDWVSRQRASELELSENELVMTREELDSLKDQIYVLHCALADARNDLAKPRHTKDSIREILDWVMDAAEPVANASLHPSSDSRLRP
jgi:hypothetical protein